MAVPPGVGEAAALLRRILAKPPRLAAGEDAMRLERLLHDTARGGRLRAVIALVDALADAGFAFTTATPAQQVSWREWRLALPDGRHVVDLRVHANRHLTSASLHDHALAPAPRQYLLNKGRREAGWRSPPCTRSVRAAPRGCSNAPSPTATGPPWTGSTQRSTKAGKTSPRWPRRTRASRPPRARRRPAPPAATARSSSRSS